jgi:SPASM domain peptide maturase of grasp-with-spasm system
VRSVICDLTRNELVFFPSAYFELLECLAAEPVSSLLDSLQEEEEKEAVTGLVQFLIEAELAQFVADPSLFPPIEESWDLPAVIQNALIDVDSVYHDFEAIFSQLDALGCQYVQLRCFSSLLGPEDLRRVLAAARHTSIKSVEVLLKYDAALPDEVYCRLVEDEPLICSLTVHSAPEEKLLTVDYGCDEVAGRYITKIVPFVTQVVDGPLHCGLITVKHLNAPSVSNFFETKIFNGCLNRKLSVDALGEIKNCPSLPQSFGNIRDTDLRRVAALADFREKWHIKKDRIATCRDCEFRYVCSDCRAYLEDPSDPFSKPLKCGYNPYTCEWEEWSLNPLKQKAIVYYGLTK